MMSLSYVVRYEMYYNGQSQNIGIFRGLDETNLGELLRARLTYPFDENLPMPPSDSYSCEETDKYVASFFTEKGEKEFEEDIYKLAKEVNDDEVFSIGKVMVKPKEENITYKDDFQCLLKCSYLADVTSLLVEMEEGVYKILENDKPKSIYKYKLEKISDVNNVNGDIIIYPNYLEEETMYIIDMENMIVKLSY